MIGSSSPNFARNAAPTSAGTFGLVASSPKGSPGASANTVNSTMLIPSRLGIAISKRLSKYRPIARRSSGARLCLAVPVAQIPQHVVPPAQPRSQLAGYPRNGHPVDDRDDPWISHHHVVHCNEQRRPFHRVELSFGGLIGLIVVLVMPATDIAALPLVVFRRDFRGEELAHEDARVRRVHPRGVHLNIAIKMPVGVRIRGVGGKINRRRYRFELHLDARLLAGLLDDRLGFLARRVDRSLKDKLQFLADLGANAIWTAFPAGLLQQLVRLFDIKFPLRVLRCEAGRVIYEISRRDPSTPVDVLLYRSTINEQFHGLPNCRIVEQRMLRLNARTLSVDFRPGVGAVELDMLDIPAGYDFGVAFGIGTIL